MPFYAFPLWGGYDLRYTELLRSVGAEDRLVSFDTGLKPGPMDFSTVKEKLAVRQAESMKFIERSLANEQ